MGMFGPRITTVFASRWRAIWFCGSMLMLAYCTVPAAKPDPNAPQAEGDAAFGRVDVKDTGLSPEAQKELQQMYDNLDKAAKL
jgi:hypothetical protein